MSDKPGLLQLYLDAALLQAMETIDRVEKREAILREALERLRQNSWVAGFSDEIDALLRAGRRSKCPNCGESWDMERYSACQCGASIVKPAPKPDHIADAGKMVEPAPKPEERDLPAFPHRDDAGEPILPKPEVRSCETCKWGKYSICAMPLYLDCDCDPDNDNFASWTPAANGEGT